MNHSFFMRRIISAEYFAAAAVTYLLFVLFAGYDWWILIVLFPLFDLSMIGYAANQRVGAALYNIGHSLIGPAMAIGLYITTAADWGLVIGMAWLFHIFVDRTLGYGLKHVEGFHHTHMGPIGKAKKKTKRKK